MLVSTLTISSSSVTCGVLDGEADGAADGLVWPSLSTGGRRDELGVAVSFCKVGASGRGVGTTRGLVVACPKVEKAAVPTQKRAITIFFIENNTPCAEGSGLGKADFGLILSAFRCYLFASKADTARS